MNKTRIQTRGVCSICGNLQALSGSTLVPHGFNIHWGFRSGSCSGTHNPHYGHKDAPNFLKSHIEALKKEELELPDQIAKAEERIAKVEGRKAKLEEQNYKRGLERFLRSIPNMIVELEEKIKNWKEADPIEVDIEVEEAELKAKRQTEAEQKKADKAAKEQEKAAKKAEREAKAAAKWKEILENNYHCVELDGEVIVEWTSAYESRNKLENKHYAATRKWLDENGIDDHHERMSIVYRIIHRVRKESSTGKQLHKF